jgi:putative ABC transport system permease protein
MGALGWAGLLWAGLFRHRTRTVLTLASIAVAFLLFALLRSVIDGFYGGVQFAGADRLITSPKYSIVDPIPLSYMQRIRALPGVSDVTHSNWFGGTYQDRSNFFPKYPVDPAAYFRMYGEYVIDPAALAAFERTRTGAVAPRQLAERFGWKVGDTIPIEANIWPKKGGDRRWEFELVGLYDGPPEEAPPDVFLFNHAYFDEARQFSEGTVGWFIVRVQDPERAGDVARGIDALFANSANETRTSTESDFQASFLKQVGDIGLIMSGILGAVFFTILLLTGNTMAQAFRERIPELAVLKTLGFSNLSVMLLVLGEAILLAVVAAAIGMGIALLLAPGIAKGVSAILPTFGIAPVTLATGFALAAGLGFVTGIVPAIQGLRLPIVDALRR